MLTELFRQVHARYSSLPVLGPILDGFAEWLFQLGYRRALVRRHLQGAWHADAALQRRGCLSPHDITREALSACLPKHAQDDPNLASTLRLLERYLVVDMTTISHWLGHASVNTTNRYATVDLQMKREAISKASPVTADGPPVTWRTNNTILQWLETL